MYVLCFGLRSGRLTQRSTPAVDAKCETYVCQDTVFYPYYYVFVLDPQYMSKLTNVISSVVVIAFDCTQDQTC